MVSLHETVGGTGWVLKDIAGLVVASGTLASGEQEGVFVALLHEYLTLRPLGVASVSSEPDASVLPLRRRQLPLRATRR